MQATERKLLLCRYTLSWLGQRAAQARLPSQPRQRALRQDASHLLCSQACLTAGSCIHCGLGPTAQASSPHGTCGVWKSSTQQLTACGCLHATHGWIRSADTRGSFSPHLPWGCPLPWQTAAKMGRMLDHPRGCPLIHGRVLWVLMMGIKG